MNLTKLVRLSLLPLVVLASACSAGAFSAPQGDHAGPGDSLPSNGDGTGEATSQLTRDLQPNVPAADTKELVAGNTAFALDLYKTLRTTKYLDKNAVFSPLSISLATAMLDAGARGDTETQIAKALHFTLPHDRLHPAFNALDLALRSLAATPKDESEGTPFQMKIVNSVWAEKTLSIVPSYLDTLATSYGAGVRLADFLHGAEGARQAINSWVEHETHDKIKDLLAQGTVTASTKLVLANAMYLKARWFDDPFDAEDTRPAAFHGKAGDTTVSMMSGHSYGYIQGNGWNATTLILAPGSLSFDIIVPDSIDEFESTFDAQTIATLLAGQSGEEVILNLPKFKIPGVNVRLGEAFNSLGVVDAFNPERADLSGVSETTLGLTDVIHQAFISVDEEGVEAAAATAFVSAGSAPGGQPKELTVDKPFVFFIRDNATNSLLFVGRVLDLK